MYVCECECVCACVCVCVCVPVFVCLFICYMVSMLKVQGIGTTNDLIHNWKVSDQLKTMQYISRILTV